jgi:putative GTP pyrophosphokinase
MHKMPEEQHEPFDFDKHEQTAITQYLRKVSFYQDLAEAAKNITEEALKRRNILVHSIESRAKDPRSFGKKASKPSKNDPNKPMYPSPLTDITDQAAIRIITFFPKTIEEINELIRTEFRVVEYSDKGEDLIEEERFGYLSVHYLVALSNNRRYLPEYQRFETAKVEVQVRTILQHAWAEIEHDIQYKSSLTIPRDIKRRFMALAGLLEIADREFQSIQDADRDLTERAEALIAKGELNQVEITSSALKTYLDKKLGADGRMSSFSYDWTAQLLLRLGFKTLEEVEKCVHPYDDDQLSRLIDGARQGQLTRFEYMLLAGMGSGFIDRHPWHFEEWFVKGRKAILEKLEENGVGLGSFDPEFRS